MINKDWYFFPTTEICRCDLMFTQMLIVFFCGQRLQHDLRNQNLHELHPPDQHDQRQRLRQMLEN
jgi:hypothetical protein